MNHYYKANLSLLRRRWFLPRFRCLQDMTQRTVDLGVDQTGCRTKNGHEIILRTAFESASTMILSKMRAWGPLHGNLVGPQRMRGQPWPVIRSIGSQVALKADHNGAALFYSLARREHRSNARRDSPYGGVLSSKVDEEGNVEYVSEEADAEERRVGAVPAR